ncbi:hypothetical protein D3C72_1196430 [compost metagenome]
MLHEQAVLEDVFRLDVQLLEVPSGSGGQRQRAHQAVDEECGDPVLWHHQAAHELCQIDHGPGMRAALCIIGIEYRRRGMATKNPSQFPGKVRAVTKARYETLSHKRRGDVCGVADQESTSLAESIAATRVESIDRLALDFQFLRIDPRRNEPRDAFRAFQLLPGFAGLQHEFPALPATGGGHVRRGPPWITDKLDVIDG